MAERFVGIWASVAGSRTVSLWAGLKQLGRFPRQENQEVRLLVGTIFTHVGAQSFVSSVVL